MGCLQTVYTWLWILLSGETGCKWLAVCGSRDDIEVTWDVSKSLVTVTWGWSDHVLTYTTRECLLTSDGQCGVLNLTTNLSRDGMSTATATWHTSTSKDSPAHRTITSRYFFKLIITVWLEESDVWQLRHLCTFCDYKYLYKYSWAPGDLVWWCLSRSFQAFENRVELII